MTGLYLHIPFCRKACTYCDFHFSTLLKSVPDVIECMQQELMDRMGVSSFSTIYFGGGTPSLLDADDIKTFIHAVETQDNPEITIEVNPDDVTERKLEEWREAGINRLSVGIQSFSDRQLSRLGRAHSSAQALNSLKAIRNAGFESWTMDLMYGLPDMDMRGWKRNIDTAFEFDPPHISAYCLNVEEGTVLDHQVRKGQVSIPDEDAQVEQLELLRSSADEHGYIHYEVSNFAKEGNLAQHNSNYWRRYPYLGIGPSAHSFDGKNRRWNIPNNGVYVRSIRKNECFWEEEQLNDTAVFNEMVMTGLRTIWGVPINDLPIALKPEQIELIQHYDSRGLLVLDDERLVLTSEGRLLADRIASDLFLVE